MSWLSDAATHGPREAILEKIESLQERIALLRSVLATYTGEFADKVLSAADDPSESAVYAEDRLRLTLQEILSNACDFHLLRVDSFRRVFYFLVGSATRKLRKTATERRIKKAFLDWVEKDMQTDFAHAEIELTYFDLERGTKRVLVELSSATTTALQADIPIEAQDAFPMISAAFQAAASDVESSRRVLADTLARFDSVIA